MKMPWKCFHGCGLDAHCGHREAELVTWWAEQLQHMAAKTPASSAKTGQRAIAKPAAVPTTPKWTPIARKPFVRAEALRPAKPDPMEAPGYSALRGW